MNFELYGEWLDFFLQPITNEKANRTVLGLQALFNYELNASFVNGKKLLTYIKITDNSLKISFNANNLSGIAHYFFDRDFDPSNESMFKTSSKISESSGKLLDLSQHIINFTNNFRVGNTDYRLPDDYKL
ncbi:MAG: hypothetical protein WC307_04225 [Candidatus Nanoarchaeia archaeon]|jgi:hypothetical protein